MRILHLPSSYLPDTLGGTEVYVDSLAMEQLRLGSDVIVAHHPEAEAAMLPELPYRVVRLPKLREPTRVELYTRRLGTPPGFRELLESERPDVLHFHAYTLGAGLDHAEVAASFGIPYVITYHIPAMSCPRGTLFRWGTDLCNGVTQDFGCSACMLQSVGLPRAVARGLATLPIRADALPDSDFTTTFAMRDLIRRWRESWEAFIHGARHIVACAAWCRDVLVANGTPPDRVSVLRQALREGPYASKLRLPLRAGPLRLGFLGRVTKTKAPDTLLQAARALQKIGVDVRCELVGPISPKEKPWLDRLLAADSGRSEYLGVKRERDVQSWLRSIDALVIPGLWMETGPLVLLEAWREGVPVLGVNIGGVREYLAEAGLGELLFEPNDVLGIVDTVLRAIEWSKEAPEVTIRVASDLAVKMNQIYCEAVQAT